MTDTRALAQTVDTSVIESVVIEGDLSRLTPQQRVSYYNSVCESLGLNPLTQPFAYIKLNGKLTLYAKRDAADQLRKLHHISIDKPDVTFTDDLVIVSVTGRNRDGRSDSDLGVVYLGTRKGDDKANAILKAITKAKRRLTLSIVGLGWMDETEVETIPNAQTIEPARLDAPPAFNPTPPDFSGWDNKQWPKLRALAVSRLGYRHDTHVKNTMRLIYGEAPDALTYDGVWTDLVAHQESKMDTPAETWPTELDADTIDADAIRDELWGTEDVPAVVA